MTAPINRKNHKDVEKTVYLTYELEQSSKKVMFELDMSFSQLVRVALDRFIQDTLSQQKQGDSRGNLPANCGSPNGLYTAEQVAQLIASMSKK
jgi:hypothetical protein